MAESIDMDELADYEALARARGDFLEDEVDENEEDDRESEEEDEESGEEDTESGEEDEGETDESASDGSEDEDDGSEEESEEESSVARIPKYRLDEVIGQRESEKERADWLQQQLEKLLAPKEKDAAPKVEYDYEAKEAEYTEALITGEAEQASKLRREIDKNRQVDTAALIAQARDEALEAAKTESKAQLDDDRFVSLVEMYEEEYKFLKHGDESYNEEAVDTVNTLMSGHMAKGESKAASLKKAIKKVVKFYDRPKKVVGNKRKKEAVERNVQASKRQPSPKSRGKKNQEDLDVDVGRLSDKEFRSLSRRERAELRGDFL